MATHLIPGHQLPVKPESGGREAQGFLTPSQDKLPQKFAVLPNRVLPIIFLPGIMGSNLRLSRQRQSDLGKTNNIAWRPDHKTESAALLTADAARRQRQLDPAQTEVDVYQTDAPTGDPDETPDERHNNASVSFTLPLDFTTPLLSDDLPVLKPPLKTKEQKARERGWGEVYFGSYGELLQRCELRLHTAFRGGKLDPWWRAIVDVDPKNWQAEPQFKLKPIKENELRQALDNCWFPVHAMGYNWLRSCRQSGIDVAERIEQLISNYLKWGFKCEKVVVITHSMGGLVARALIHPKMGNLEKSVLGMVHGVMPAMGAAAAYKRMRCGFEDHGLNLPSKIIGNYGNEVTAVLGNSPGGLELLPNKLYGNEWLLVTHKNHTPITLPKNSDPYEEIYKLKNEWYRLINEPWLNPAKNRSEHSGLEKTFKLLDAAKNFHEAIQSTYHPNSFAHYGASDKDHKAWHRVVWTIGTEIDVRAQTKDEADKLTIADDNRQGTLRMTTAGKKATYGMPAPWVGVRMQPPTDPGDQTVPTHSADHQYNSGKFRGIFKQSGYEHQDSYKNESALHSTLYSLVRIIETMNWSL